MSPFFQFLTTTFSLGTIAMQVATLILVVLAIVAFKKKEESPIVSFASRYAVLFSFIIVTLSTIGSLIYSEIGGFEPCKFCWLQRIALYPLVIIFGFALWKKELRAWGEALALAIIGLLLGLYHYALQMAPIGTLPCSATGPSCTDRLFTLFGYVTFPMMTVGALGLVIILLIVQKFSRTIKTN